MEGTEEKSICTCIQQFLYKSLHKDIKLDPFGHTSLAMNWEKSACPVKSQKIWTIYPPLAHPGLWTSLKIDKKGTDQLWRILISESAHLIWVLRCEHVINEALHSAEEIMSRWFKAIHLRLSVWEHIREVLVVGEYTVYPMIMYSGLQAWLSLKA